MPFKTWAEVDLKDEAEARKGEKMPQEVRQKQDQELR